MPLIIIVIITFITIIIVLFSSNIWGKMTGEALQVGSSAGRCTQVLYPWLLKNPPYSLGARCPPNWEYSLLQRNRCFVCSSDQRPHLDGWDHLGVRVEASTCPMLTPLAQGSESGCTGRYTTSTGGRVGENKTKPSVRALSQPPRPGLREGASHGDTH